MARDREREVKIKKNLENSRETRISLGTAISFLTEVFAILNFGIQFIFDSQISHFAIDFDFIVISFLN